MGDEALERNWKLIPEDVDVLITHGPPYGIQDTNLQGECCGDKILLKRLKEIKPKLHIFGHIHEGYTKEGVLVDGMSTTFVNASITSMGSALNEPVVYEI